METPETVSFKYLPTAASVVLTRWVATARAARASSGQLVTPLWDRTARALRLSLPAFCFGADERRSSKVAPSITISNHGSDRCYSNSFMVRCHGVGRVAGRLGNNTKGAKVWHNGGVIFLLSVYFLTLFYMAVILSMCHSIKISEKYSVHIIFRRLNR